MILFEDVVQISEGEQTLVTQLSARQSNVENTSKSCNKGCQFPLEASLHLMSVAEPQKPSLDTLTGLTFKLQMRDATSESNWIWWNPIICLIVWEVEVVACSGLESSIITVITRYGRYGAVFSQTLLCSLHLPIICTPNLTATTTFFALFLVLRMMVGIHAIAEFDDCSSSVGNVELHVCMLGLLGTNIRYQYGVLLL